MAVSRASLDWAKAMKNALPEDVTKMKRLKALFDSTGVQVSSLPDKLPQIEWSYYKEHASDPKLVADIEKMYNSLKIDRPKVPADKLAEVDHHHKMDKKRFERFATFAKSQVESAEVIKRKFEKMIPVKDMNAEDWTLTFPHWSASIDTPPTIGFKFDRTIGLSREEARAYAIPDPRPYSNKQAWKDWDEKWKKWYD